MPSSGEFGGLGQRQTPVRPVANADFNGARLTAQEGFVLSRVDATSTLETLCLLSGIDRQATCQILRRLAELGLIKIGDDINVGPKAQQPEHTDPASPPCPPDRASRSTPSQSVPAVLAEPLPDEPDVELKPEVRAAIRGLYARLQEMSFFQLLDVDINADTATIRRAYFKRSKEFHPDRYFSKRIGPYKPMLDEIFKQVSAAYHFLEDEPQRAAYRDMVTQEMADAAVLAQVEAQGAQALQEEAAEESYQLPPLAAPPPSARPERRSRTEPRPKFPWEVLRSPTPTQTPTPASSLPTGPYLSVEEQRAREERRLEDRRRRFRRITNPLLGRPRQARQFYEQGLRQLAKSQVLAAAASLKLALTFGGDDPDVQKVYREAVDKSRGQTADNCFKRGVFEESVGRIETARRYFVQAADTLPKSAYLEKAAEALLLGNDLIKARDYATRAVQTDPKSGDARITLAKVYQAAGMTKNARRELEEALTLEPGNATAKDLLKTIKWG